MSKKIASRTGDVMIKDRNNNRKIPMMKKNAR